MYEKIKSLFPKGFLKKNEDTLRIFLSLYYIGKKHKCTVCNFNMSAFIQLSNTDKICPKCGSLPRTRRLFKLLTNKIKSDSTRILHFSPPKCLSKKLKKNKHYLTTDFANEFVADKHYDITNIKEKDTSYDLIICYHVLEHIEEDSLAMKELYRILDKNGLCIIQTPFKEGAIYEDKNIVSKQERTIHFGQDDHVRIYSVNGLKERLTNVGFTVETMSFEEKKDNYFGFNENENILIAKKE